jgi:hypothetical protein
MASEAFALWRSRLATGLERARAARERGHDHDPVAMVGEVLADARAGLFDEARRSRTLAPYARAGLTFTSGALGGAVSGSTGGVGRRWRSGPRLPTASLRPLRSPT